MSKKEITVKLSSTFEKNLSGSVRDEKILIAACPNFEIDGEYLNLVPRSTKIGPENLVTAFLQVGNRETRVLLGLAWLYWDYLILDSLAKQDVSTALEMKKTLGDFKTEKSSPNTLLDSLGHPNPSAIKQQAQEKEIKWLEAQENLKSYKDQIILSGTLLDNKLCRQLYDALNQHCQSTEGKALAKRLGKLTDKFYQTHFKKLLEKKGEDELVCKYFNGEPPTLVNTLLTQYICFEYASFVHLASQGYKFLFTDHVDGDMEKTMGMVMAFFVNQATLPLTNRMQIFRIGFSEKKLHTKADSDIDFSSDNSRSSSKRSGSESSSQDETTPPGTPTPKQRSLQEKLQKEKIELKLRLIGHAYNDTSTSAETKLAVIHELAKTAELDMTSHSAEIGLNVTPEPAKAPAPEADAVSRQVITRAGIWCYPTLSAKTKYVAYAMSVVAIGVSIYTSFTRT